MFNLKSKLMVSALIVFTATSFADDPAEIAVEPKDPEYIDGSIKFKGLITDSSCNITQKEQEVELGTHSAAVLKEINSRTNPVEFTIDIKDCSLSMSSLTIAMNGVAHADNNAIFALNTNEESAGKVGIQISTEAGDPVTPAGISEKITLRQDSRDYSKTYAANYLATGLATPGPANATVNYTVTYN
ncbi:fimbrial protein [Morganella psychrotolerans]|uniref:Fimbrial-type adhesion domain-containing protein n=1 Tax=Morganella psychrotolerans TaxID=368603 RepID=A0A1B8H084_9GAMM|nr:fimbrial protein [Morganella psychrotolerans]OBU02498.1 hypothetical protein AYY17_12660 [Morganella psychrotolerans]